MYFRQLDMYTQCCKGAGCNFYDDKLAVSRKLGYKSFSEALLKEYLKTRSSQVVADHFQATRTMVLYKLKFYNFPIRTHGGNRHKRDEKGYLI